MTRKLTLAAIMTALGLVFLYLSAILPTGRLALAAMACLATAAVVIEAGPWHGFGAYAATSTLAILLTPSSAVMYVLFFGWYPSVKYLVERIDKRIPEWIIKLLLFNAAFAALYFIFPAVITDITPNFAEIFYVLAIILNAAFIVFDIGLSKLINYYARHIFPKIRRK